MAGAFWDKERELHRVPKAKTSYYSFKAVEKNGKTFMDVREHFTRADGSVQHTTKGMSIPAERFADMSQGFQVALEKYIAGE